MRRDLGWLVSGNRCKERLLLGCIKRLARRPNFRIVSDSQSALSYWDGLIGAKGAYVSIPSRMMAIRLPKTFGENVQLGLLGLFRHEKGADRYESIIEGVLERYPFATVHCQLPKECVNPEQDWCALLTARYCDHPRVRLHVGHLTKADYEGLLRAIDVVLAPYHQDRYGAGSSGLMHEALAAGACVVSTPIQWGREEYGTDARVVWVSDNSAGRMLEGLDKCLRQILPNRAALQSGLRKDTFRETWLNAILTSLEHE